TSVTFSSNYTEIAPPGGRGAWYGIYLNPIPSYLSSTSTVWEFYGNIYDGVSHGSYAGTAGGAPGNFNGYAFSEGNTNSSLIYLANGAEFSDTTSKSDSNSNKVYSMVMISSKSADMQLNYANIFSSTGLTSESPTYFVFGVYTSSSPQYVYWLRARALPPNGVMPRVSMGKVESSIYYKSLNLNGIYQIVAFSNSTCSVSMVSISSYFNIPELSVGRTNGFSLS
ncbi:MAG: hypothetical protein QXP36_10590, partial [Conexivisphaerales archaeon]